MKIAKSDFIIVGGGIFGLTAALELARRKHRVCVLNPDHIPHPLASSTDISKVVRMEYGTDETYMDMAIDSMEGWRAWNEGFDRPLYHETGFLVLTTEPLEYDFTSFAGASYINLLKRGYHPDRLNPELIAALYPAFNNEAYSDGFFNPVGGYAESGRVVEALAEHARSLGVIIHEGQTVNAFLQADNRLTGVTTREGMQVEGDHVIVCAGNYTPYLLPELQPYMLVTGHPVFHLKPELPASYMPPDFPVFAADIQNTGWYGFPYHPMAEVVKVANHGVGIPVHPEHDAREVTESDVRHLRTFLRKSIPSLESAQVVATRLCCYTDTLDGHFWIDRHPEINNMTVATGGSGHAFKMAPLLGEIIADTAEGFENKWAPRFRWRELGEDTGQEEEARHK